MSGCLTHLAITVCCGGKEKGGDGRGRERSIVMEAVRVVRVVMKEEEHKRGKKRIMLHVLVVVGVMVEGVVKDDGNSGSDCEEEDWRETEERAAGVEG